MKYKSFLWTLQHKLTSDFIAIIKVLTFNRKYFLNSNLKCDIGIAMFSTMIDTTIV